MMESGDARTHEKANFILVILFLFLALSLSLLVTRIATVAAKGYDRVRLYISTRNDNGKVKTCRKSFLTKNNGHGETIVATSYSDCPFLTIR